MSMPEVERTVAQSAAVCQRYGLSKRDAYLLVSEVATDACQAILGETGHDSSWLRMIAWQATAKALQETQTPAEQTLLPAVSSTPCEREL
jgi:hypothetical protein